MEKAEKEEEERRKIDREEAAIAGEKRRMAIERANKMLYDDSDRVKTFHSQLMLSDVLKEREAQIEVRRSLSLVALSSARECLCSQP